MNINIQRLEIVARGLMALPTQVVFVGGATSSLYTDVKGAEFRPTDDIDCIVEVLSKFQFTELSEQLRACGFKHDTRAEAPICRWIYSDIIVDVMPLVEEILGFSNRWYEQGYKHREQYELPSGAVIHILPLAYFIATKLEAFNSRGHNDCRGSSDIEDILLVIDGCQEWEAKVAKSDIGVGEYLQKEFQLLLGRDDFREAAFGCISPHEASRAEKIVRRLERFCSTTPSDEKK